MYLEFLLLIQDYFKTLNRRIAIYEWFFPFMIATFVFLTLKFGNDSQATSIFKENTISLLGILVGFSITVVTILTTGQSKNLDEIKKIKTDLIINNVPVTLYHLLLTNFTYSVVVEIFGIVSCLLYPLVIKNFDVPINIKYLGFAVLVLLIMHLLLLTIRNLTDFYFTLIKK